MKEKEFRQKNPNLELTFDIYYYLDENGDVVLDEDSMREEWEEEIHSINEELDDELKKIVREKIRQIKDGKPKN